MSLTAPCLTVSGKCHWQVHISVCGKCHWQLHALQYLVSVIDRFISQYVVSVIDSSMPYSICSIDMVLVLQYPVGTILTFWWLAWCVSLAYFSHDNIYGKYPDSATLPSTCYMAVPLVSVSCSMGISPMITSMKSTLDVYHSNKVWLSYIAALYWNIA